MAEPTKTTAKGPTIYALNLETNEVTAIGVADVEKLPEPSKIQLFAKEADAQAVASEKLIAKTLRAHQVRSAKAKVERERVAYAEKNPARARQNAIKTEAALSAHLERIEKTEAKKKAAKE